MRRICPESGRATGLVVPPVRRVRCMLCGNLVHLVPMFQHIVVARHYRQVAEGRS